MTATSTDSDSDSVAACSSDTAETELVESAEENEGGDSMPVVPVDLSTIVLTGDHIPPCGSIHGSSSDCDWRRGSTEDDWQASWRPVPR